MYCTGKQIPPLIIPTLLTPIKYQACLTLDPTNETCTPLQSLPFKFTGTGTALEINSTQYTLLRVLQNAVVQHSYAALSALAIDALAVNDVIGSLPNDQWVRELSRWVSIGLSHLQIGISDYAVGLAVRDPSTAGEYERPPREEGQRRLCGMVRMRKPGGFTYVSPFPSLSSTRPENVSLLTVIRPETSISSP